jgi:hypothetical protein
MAIWKISNYHKKSCVEIQTWSKDGKTFTYSEGFRWGTFFKEDEERPEVDLKNEDGFDPYFDDWELDMMDDGCWADYEFGDDWTDEEREAVEAIIEEDGIYALEEHGWINTDTEVELQGPLLLENEDTGETWNGEEE